MKAKDITQSWQELGYIIGSACSQFSHNITASSIQEHEIQASSSSYKEAFYIEMAAPRVEAGSNTSTVTLRVVGGDEKGSLECETVTYGHESYGTRTRK
jgi:hypothetical protein